MRWFALLVQHREKTSSTCVPLFATDRKTRTQCVSITDTPTHTNCHTLQRRFSAHTQRDRSTTPSTRFFDSSSTAPLTGCHVGFFAPIHPPFRTPTQTHVFVFFRTTRARIRQYLVCPVLPYRGVRLVSLSKKGELRRGR